MLSNEEDDVDGDDEEDDGAYAPHFLMQSAQELNNSRDSQEFNNSWQGQNWQEDTYKKPEIIEVPSVDGSEKKYKCSFCPNKVCRL